MSVHEQFAEDLALYALGTLPGGERLALEKHLEGCASCRRELEVVRGDLAVVALTANGPRPPARSRQRLVSAIAKEPRTSVAPAAAAARTEPSRTFAWWGVLGWAAALGLVLVAISLMRTNSALERNLASLKAQFGDQEAKLRQANDILATLIDPEAKKIELVAAGSKPQPRGKAIYRRQSRGLIFLASSLPQLPPEKIYELWLFPADGGAPIAAGLFRPDSRGNATVVNPPLPEGVEAKNFAVTLEPESGSHESPRGTAVIVGAGE
ncbi:MAG TPA: anti-sigma factor [Terriglobales bacterium]|nr:anti-sigma factor [Terriglobales bacterium]